MDVTSGPLLGAALISAAAGAVSFASPCVLPLVPGYLAFVSGLSGAEIDTGSQRARGTVLAGSGLFVLGFAVFFTVIGGAFGALGRELSAQRQLVGVFGGVLVLLMGLFLLGVLRPRRLEGDTRALHLSRRTGLLGAFPLGLVFGAGWTPCIGPTLASILTLSTATSAASPGRGAFLAFCYAVGLGLPFILVGQLLGRGVAAVGALRRHSRRIEQLGGAALVVIGVLLASGLWDQVLAALRPSIAGFTPAL
jgi:cytochrome c-type biogenesis protein